MDVQKCILFITFFVIQVTSGKKFYRKKCRSDRECMNGKECINNKCKYPTTNDNLLNEKFCVINKDCPALYYCNKKLHRCKIISTVNQIMEKQSCKKVFKSFCLQNHDCACNEENMRCEDNECVYMKTFLRKPKKLDGKCKSNRECPFLNICDKWRGVCREARNTFELMILIAEGSSKRKKNNR